MKAFIILLVTLLIVTNAVGQKLPADNYTGVIKDTNKNGKIIKETPYINGIKNGVEKEYFENGYLKKIQIYAHGKKNGISKEYGGVHARLISENMYKNDSLNGLSKVYHTFWKSVWKPECVNPYAKSRPDTIIKEGKPKGKSENYYVDSLARKEMYYKKGKLNGISKVYGKKGELQAQNTFVNGKLNGISKVYHDDGTLKSQMLYKDGRLCRDSTEYDRNGKLKILTKSIFYNEKRQLMADTNYKISKAQMKKIIPIESYITKYFLDYLDYPEQARETYDTGHLIVSFEIGNTDTLQQVRIEKTDEKKNYLSNSVKRVFKKFPIPESAYSKRLANKRYFLAISFQIPWKDYKQPGFIEIKRYIIIQSPPAIE